MVDHYKTKVKRPIKPLVDDQQIVWYAAKPKYFQDILPGQLVDWKLEKWEETEHPDARLVYYHGKPRPWETKLWTYDM